MNAIDLVNFLGSLVGIAGFLFGLWRFVLEKRARLELDRRNQELADALSRLKSLSELSSKLDRYTSLV